VKPKSDNDCFKIGQSTVPATDNEKDDAFKVGLSAIKVMDDSVFTIGKVKRKTDGAYKV